MGMRENSDFGNEIFTYEWVRELEYEIREGEDQGIDHRPRGRWIRELRAEVDRGTEKRIWVKRVK